MIIAIILLDIVPKENWQSLVFCMISMSFCLNSIGMYICPDINSNQTAHNNSFVHYQDTEASLCRSLLLVFMPYCLRTWFRNFKSIRAAICILCNLLTFCCDKFSSSPIKLHGESFWSAIRRLFERNGVSTLNRTANLNFSWYLHTTHMQFVDIIDKYI